MSRTQDLTEELLRQAEAEGYDLTEEEAAAMAAKQVFGSQYPPAAESRTDGAPSEDIEGLTPQAYYDDMADMSSYYQQGGASQPSPDSEAWNTEGDLLQYSPGMSDEEYDAAKANRAHRQRMIRGMGGDGGYGAQVHSQQPMDLGTAEQQAEWREWVAEDPSRMQRYDPAAFQAWLSSKRSRESQSHAQRLERTYGPDAAEAYLESQATGGPMDMSLLRTSPEQMRINERRATERAAREEGPAGPARDWLSAQDGRSGYRGAMGGSDASRRHASGPVDAEGNPVNADGTPRTPETMSQRYARRTAERKQELDDRLAAYSSRNMLAGNDPRQNLVNAYNTLDPEMQQQAMLGMMFPQGSTPLDVQRARAEAEARINANQAGAAFNNPLVQQQAAVAKQQQQADMMTWAENHIRSTYGGHTGFFSSVFNTPFTAAEQENAVNDLLQRYPNITRQQAEAIVSSIAARSRTSSGTSSPPPTHNPEGTFFPPGGPMG